MQQTLAIGLFVRGDPSSKDVPATIRYRAVAGRRSEKYEQLETITLDGEGWREARTAWQAPLTPAATTSDWDEWPALDDLMPWTAPGIKPNKTWVYSPHPSVLAERWRALVGEQDPDRKVQLFQETSDTKVDRSQTPLPGSDVRPHQGPFAEEKAGPPAPVRVGYRAFDRQWLIPDARLLETPRPSLWWARSPGQVFLVEQSAHAIDSGPALLFSALVPDMDHFNNRGGRALAMTHPDGTPNLAPGLLAAIGARLGRAVAVEELVAYLAAVAAHPGFTAMFSDELSTPGVRIPLTSDAELFDRAVAVGESVLWLHTFDAAAANADAGRPSGTVRYPAADARQPLSRKAVTAMPTILAHDEAAQTLSLGDGEWGPVTAAVRAYDVGGRNVLDSWFNYRKAVPGGRRTATTSPLADLHVDAWPSEWTVELIDLLTVLTRLTELEDEQRELLDEIAASELLTMHGLAAAGVRWPTERKHRSVRMPVATEGSLPAE